MKFKISYFYQIRFFKPYQVPVSTAVWDPKWYHRDYGNSYLYIDKRGVINGVRCMPLAPGDACHNLCRGREECFSKNPENCQFLHEYGKQLAAIDFDAFKTGIESAVRRVLQRNKKYNGEEPEIILIVHEAPTNPCSERGEIIKWFKNNGYELEEFQKE